jgi:hypothetical protein
MKTKYLLILLLFFMLYQPFIGVAQVSEYRLKAIFLERFTRFIEWPDTSNLKNKQVPFVIGVYRDDNFRRLLQSIYSEQTIKSHKVKIRTINSFSEVANCHLVYIGKGVRKGIRKIVKEAQANSVLTVGENLDILNKGVIISFFTADHKIRFKINKDAADRSGLELDYHLLGSGR